MPQRRLNAKSNVHATNPALLQAVVALRSVLSRNRSKADVLEGAMALIEDAQSADVEVLAEVMELHLRRGEYQAVSEAAARVPGELTSKVRATLATAAAQCGYLPSLDKGHPCSLSSSTVVTILVLAEEEELLSSAATELAHLQAALDPKHVGNLVHAVAQRDGPQMIRDLIMRCARIPMLWAVRRQRRGMRRPSFGGLSEREISSAPLTSSRN